MMLAEEAREAGREQLPKEMVVHCKDSGPSPRWYFMSSQAGPPGTMQTSHTPLFIHLVSKDVVQYLLSTSHGAGTS